MTHCLLYFRVQMHTSYSERVVIVGNIKPLGSWDPHKGLDLTTSPSDYPHWYNLRPIKLFKGSTLEFKCIVMKNDEVVRWETLPSSSNRRYLIKYEKAVIKCKEGLYEGEEILHKVKKMRSRLLSQEKSTRIDDISSSESDLSISSSKSAPFEELANHRSFLYDSFTNQNLSQIPCEDLITREISFYAISSNFDKKLNSLNKIPHFQSSNNTNKRIKTLKLLKMLNNSNSSSSSSFKEDSLSKKPKKTVRLCDLYENLRKKNPEKMKLSFLKTRPMDLMSQKHEELAQNIAYDEHIIILTLFLPLRIRLLDDTMKDQSKRWEISFLYDKPLFEMQSFLFTRLLTHYKRMMWVGMLKDPPILDDVKLQGELTDYLYERYKCKVLWRPIKSISIDNDNINDPWEKAEIFYKRIWIPLLRKVLDVQRLGEISQGVESLREAVGSFQQWFFKGIEGIIEENSMIVILDSFLNPMTENLYKKGLKVALYSHYGFPSIESLLLMPEPEEIVKNFLNCQILAFNSYKQAKRLLDAVEISGFGFKTESDRGNMLLSSMNRRILLKTVYPGLDANHLETHMKKHSEFIQWYNLLVKEVKGRKVLLCIENLEDFKGIEQRLLFLKRFLIETGNKYNVKILFLLKSRKNSVLQDELFNIKDLINKINNTVFNNPNEMDTLEDFLTIKLLESPFTKPQISAFMALSSVFLLNQRADSLINALEFLALSEENGVCLISEFCEHVHGFNGFYAFNPFRYESFKERLKQILACDKEVLAQISNNNKSLLRKNSILNWFEGIIIELKRIQRKSTFSETFDIGFSAGFSADSVLLKQLKTDYDPYQVLECYKSTKNRLFVFESLGKTKKQVLPLKINSYIINNFNKKEGFTTIPIEILKTIEILANDPKNSFFLISDESLEALDIALNKIRSLGILCEYGYFYKTDGNMKWRELFKMDFRWKTKVLDIMKLFKEKTENSQIISKDSYIVWNYELCDHEFARKQAVQLEITLKNVLRADINKVEVIHGNCSVEVRPFGVNKATIVEMVIQKVFMEKGKLDFMLNFEEFGKENGEIMGGLMVDGMKKMLKESSGCFESNLKSFAWLRGNNNSWNEDEEFLKLLHRLLTLYL